MKSLNRVKYVEKGVTKEVYSPDNPPTKSAVGLVNVDNVKQYSASNPPPYPVTSVEGKTGAVYLRSLVSGPSIIAATAYATSGSTIGVENEGVLLQGFPASSANPRVYFFRVRPTKTANTAGGRFEFYIVGYNSLPRRYVDIIELPSLQSDTVYCMIAAGDKLYHLFEHNIVVTPIHDDTSSADWYLGYAQDERDASTGISADFYVSYISFLI